MDRGKRDTWRNEKENKTLEKNISQFGLEQNVREREK